MKTISMPTVLVAVIICLAGLSRGEEAATEAKKVSPGEAAFREAADAKKHLYIFFYSDEQDAKGEIRKSFDAAMAKMSDVAKPIAIRREAPEEKTFVEKFGLNNAPMPLILVMAPNGAITQGVLGQNMSEEKLRAGIASPAQQNCMKALQENKFVLLCAYKKDLAADDPTLKVVTDFKADAKNAKTTEIVRVDPGEEAEQKFLKQFKISAESPSTTVVLAPPRTLLKTFVGPVTKAGLEAALKPSTGG
jgi:hypothetical protein